MNLERDFGPEQSWKLALEPDPASGVQRLVWHGTQDGKAVRFESEPKAGFLKRFGVFLFSLLPIEDLL